MSKVKHEEQLMNNQKSKKLTKRAGIFLFVLSCILYGIAFIIPFTPFSANTKVIMATLFAISGEVAFWVSCIIVGKELMKRYRRYLNPVNWFKRSRDKNVQ